MNYYNLYKISRIGLIFYKTCVFLHSQKNKLVLHPHSSYLFTLFIHSTAELMRLSWIPWWNDMIHSWKATANLMNTWTATRLCSWQIYYAFEGGIFILEHNFQVESKKINHKNIMHFEEFGLWHTVNLNLFFFWLKEL